MHQLSLVFSLVACVASGVALFREPPTTGLGKGMADFDFSTPSAAYRSHLDMQQDLAMRGMLEYGAAVAKERTESSRVHDQVTYQDKEILFISYMLEGKLKHDARGMRLVRQGVWAPAYVNPWDMEGDDEPLGKRIKAWEKKGDD